MLTFVCGAAFFSPLPSSSVVVHIGPKWYLVNEKKVFYTVTVNLFFTESQTRLSYVYEALSLDMLRFYVI
jgi:hypothetical protein